jgi:hypothetical protein
MFSPAPLLLHADTATQTYIHTYLHTDIPTYLHTHITTYLHTCICAYVDTYTDTHRHTHTYMDDLLGCFLHISLRTCQKVKVFRYECARGRYVVRADVLSACTSRGERWDLGSRRFSPGKEDEWAPSLVWAWWRGEKSLQLLEVDHWLCSSRSVSRWTDRF